MYTDTHMADTGAPAPAGANGAALLASVMQYATAGVFKPTSDEYRELRSLIGGIYAIEGGIGVGKTTLGTSVVAMLNGLGIPAVFLEEHLNNHLLELFYRGNSDKTLPNYAFAFQMCMLMGCQNNYVRAQFESGRIGGGARKVVIIDRTVWGNAVFAAHHHDSGNISADEFATYLETLRTGGPYELDAVVYLDLEPSKALHRIKRRGRGAEKSCPEDYLRALDRAYYMQVCTQIMSGHTNMIVASNEIYMDAMDVLKLLAAPRLAAPTIAIAPHPQISDADVRRGFGELATYYTGADDV